MFRNPVTDLIVVLVVALLIFGPKRLPLLGRSLGQGLREFKDSIGGNSSEEAEDRPSIAAAPEAHTAVSPAAAQPQAPAEPSTPPPSTAPSSGVGPAEVGSAEQRS